MKRGLVMVMGTIAVLAVAASAQAQGRGGAPACTTVACDVLGDWGRTYGAADRRGRSDAGRQVRVQADAGRNRASASD